MSQPRHAQSDHPSADAPDGTPPETGDGAAAPSPPGTRGPFATTLRSPRAWLVLLVVAALGTASDLWTKSWAFANVADEPVEVVRADVLAALARNRGLGALTPPDRLHAIPNLLDFTLVLNPGAVFGVGAGRRSFFIVFTAVAIAFGLWVFARWTRPRDWLAHLGLGLLMAGGLGNLYDRLTYACVRDFIHPLPGVHLPFGLAWPNNASTEVWPWVSNVADAYLIVGIILILWHSWRGGAHEAREHKSAQHDET
ncbi:MAG: signal peptidase II [Phycisphaerales bacterium]|nr:signal peptidase II [Phycisphaerales bacterium]MCB9841498.1 signal peptidase II [Phycisphaeraceae bacterium]